MTALSILLGRALTASVLPVELLVFYQVILPSVLYRADHTRAFLELLGGVPAVSGILGTATGMRGAEFVFAIPMTSEYYLVFRQLALFGKY